MILLPTLASILMLGLFAAPSAYAHATGENYVWLNVEESHVEGRFEMRLSDAREMLGVSLPELDPKAEGAALEPAREQLRAQAEAVQSYLRERFEIRANGQVVPYEFTGVDVTPAHGLGHFVQFLYRTGTFDVPRQLDIRNEVLLDKGDRFHRSLLLIEYDRRSGKEYGAEFTALVFGANHSEQTLELDDVRGLLRVREFIWQGVLHIWIGIDHVLFLIALLLTAVLVRRKEEDELDGRGPWEPVAHFKSAFWKIVTIVTTFTVAHSVTLSLAALDIISLPGRVVESIIALSIVLVALNNIWPKVREGHWLVIFFFGLFHGMGFASVMGELPFRMMHLMKVIVAFNIGVEIGQVVIVAAAFPVLFLLRRSKFYQPILLKGGSALIGLLALWWFIERAFAL